MRQVIAATTAVAMSSASGVQVQDRTADHRRARVTSLQERCRESIEGSRPCAS